MSPFTGHFLFQNCPWTAEGEPFALNYGMAPYKVCSKIEKVEDRYLCKVAAVPLDDPGHRFPASSHHPSRVSSESRVLQSHALAVECCAEMIQAMTYRIEKRGGEVVMTQMVG